MKKHQLEFESFTHHLNQHEAADPKSVIDDFFNFSTLPESKRLLWNWLKVLTGEDFEQFEAYDQDKLLRFFENLEKLVEASYIIHSKYSS